ncbi:MAG TPA: glycosyltransferase [bacterium]|nr:glycosyltransferase [bacterium]
MRRVLHLGSYLHGVNDIVYLMRQDLTPLCELTAVDMRLYPGRWRYWPLHRPLVEPEGKVNWIRPERIGRIIARARPEAIICNAGGLSFRPEHHQRLADQGIIRVGIALSDPDVFPDHGRLFARYFDLFYTNAEKSLADYQAIGVRARLLRFAGSPRLHRPRPEVPRTCDVVVVGGARPDRRELVDKLRSAGFSVGLFGRGWNSPPRRDVIVRGESHVQAINSGKIYLSFSQTMAGYINIKVGIFEAAACGACILTEKFPEMESCFEYGQEILGYTSHDEAVELVRTYIADPERRQEIADNCYRRFGAEHTWNRRWEQVLTDLERTMASAPETK